jgi:transposase
MDVVNPVCCGIDVHKEMLVACLRKVVGNSLVEKTTRTCGTTRSELLELQAWLVGQQCPIVVVESTGVYWKPLYHVLRSTCEVVVANPFEVRQRPGKKRDVADAEWLAELLAHGLVTTSFLPPPEIAALRDLTRLRVGLVQTRTQAKNRVAKVLEDTNLKFQCVLTDLFGVTGRSILDALVSGERSPERLSQLARGRLRSKVPLLALALEGQFTEHHALQIKIGLELLDTLTAQIATIDAELERLLLPLSTEVELLDSIPGVDRVAARDIIAEIGVDMSRFGSDKRLASWAKMSPGNNESAGKRHSGRTGRGNKYLRRLLVQCAWAAMKTETHLGKLFRRLRARIGAKKAAMAVGHRILVISYHVLSKGEPYDESRYDHLHDREESRATKKALKVLEHLGYRVVLQPRLDQSEAAALN